MSTPSCGTSAAAPDTVAPAAFPATDIPPPAVVVPGTRDQSDSHGNRVARNSHGTVDRRDARNAPSAQVERSAAETPKVLKKDVRARYWEGRERRTV
jgi:hypothetical protein